VLLLAVLVPLGRRVVQGLRGAFGGLGVGFAAGLTLAALHALIDFNFHLPANAALAAILAGALGGLPWRART